MSRFGIVNRGTGAGGANTNRNGKGFELKTNITPFLTLNGYSSDSYRFQNRRHTYLMRDYTCCKIVFVSQGGFKNYIKHHYNREPIRLPDEAFIVEYPDGKFKVKILEKKAQNTEGSVELKLWTADYFQREYSKTLGCPVEYAFCVNGFLKTKLESTIPKYRILGEMFKEDSVTVFYGEESDYFQLLYKWITSDVNQSS